MQGFPEYAYCLERNEPPEDTDTALVEVLKGAGNVVPSTWLAIAESSCDNMPVSGSAMAFALGYLAAVNRIPIFVIDPQEAINAR